MKQQAKYGGEKQQGVALPIVMVILVLSAMIVLFMANTSKKEQQISADQYRTEQSLNAAMAGLDWATDYYNTKGLDYDNNNIVDYLSGSSMQWCIGDSQSLPLPNGQKCSDLVGLGGLVVQSRAFFCDPNDAKFWSNKPETCDDAVIGAEKVGVVAMGYSDDNTARRVITVVLAGAPILPPKGPGQPLTTKSNIAFTGNISIINRYFNVNVMAGGPVKISASAFSTHVAGDAIPLGVERFNEAKISRFEMIHEDTDRELDSKKTSRSGSTEKRGNNADVLENVSELANLCTVNCSDDQKDEFFEYFLNTGKEEIKEAARGIDQFYATCAELTGNPPTSGVIWVDEDCDPDMDFGSLEEPAALFVNGDTGLDNNTVIHGLVYVAGTLTAYGGAVVKGSVIVEGDFLTQGAGTMALVYDPVAIDPGPSFTGLRSIVPGTWKDWVSN